MEFICLQENIENILRLSERMISTKTTIPILENVLLQTNNDKVWINTTDLEIGFKSWVEAEIITEGTLTVSAKKLLEIIRSFPKGNIKIVQVNNNLRIQSADKKVKTRFMIQGIPKDNYPDMPLFVEEDILILKDEELQDAIKKTIASVSKDETRYFLNGILFEITQGKQVYVSTDGKRLTYLKKEEEGKYKELRVIVPSKVLHEILRILESYESENKKTKISVTEKQIFFRIGEMEIFSTLYEGQFPDYTTVIPERGETKIVLNRKVLEEAIKRVSLIVDEKISLIRFDIREGFLRVQGRNALLGEAQDEVEIEYKGEDIEIAFNYRYILDAIKEIVEEEVEIYLQKDTGPMLINGKGTKDYFAVIMPMKLPTK